MLGGSAFVVLRARQSASLLGDCLSKKGAGMMGVDDEARQLKVGEEKAETRQSASLHGDCLSKVEGKQQGVQNEQVGAQDGRLVVKVRVGKAPKKLRIGKEKFIEIPDFQELPVSTYEVSKVVPVYEELRNSIYITHSKLFSVARANLPFDSSTVYLLLDRYGLIPDMGSRVLSVRELSARNRKTVIEKAVSLGWLKQKEDMSLVRLHEAVFSMDVNAFFKRYGSRWKEILDLWICEGLDKSPELVDCFKATQVPFLKGVPSYWQPYNSHSFILTNTGTGKSTFAEIAGQTVGIDLSVSGIFGSNVQDYSKQVVGQLSGSGWFLIDEIENLVKYEYSRDIMLSLLSYLETGSVERRLKIPVKCNGTKAVWFTSNPTSNDMLESVTRFFRILQSDADTARLGRRMSFFICGNDLKAVNVQGSVSSIRGIMPRFLHLCFLKYWDKRIEPLLKAGRRWADFAEKEDLDIKRTFEAKALVCPNPTAAHFITGLGMNLKRVRMSAFRIATLESLNSVVERGYKASSKDVLEQAELTYGRLVSYNLKSLDNLTLAVSKLEATKECAQQIHEKFPSISSRSIASMIGVSHQTVNRWLGKEVIEVQ